LEEREERESSADLKNRGAGNLDQEHADRKIRAGGTVKNVPNMEKKKHQNHKKRALQAFTLGLRKINNQEEGRDLRSYGSIKYKTRRTEPDQLRIELSYKKSHESRSRNMHVIDTGHEKELASIFKGHRA